LVSRGRYRWSNALDGRSGQRLPRLGPRWTKAPPPTWPAAPTTRLPIGEGFCVFNDVAIASRVLQRDRHARRIAIVDLDVHQGNGTAAIFTGDASVFTFSMHGAQNFPFRKEVSDLDVPLKDGTKDDEYLELLQAHLPAALNGHQPDFVFYLAGADPYEGDRLGRLKLTIDGLRQRDEIVIGACRRAGLPLAISMSGGYAPDIDAIVTIHANTIRMAARGAMRIGV